MAHSQDFTKGSVSKGLWRFALPILWGNLLESVNGSVNSIWVGHILGEGALAATLNANAVVGFLFAVTFGIAWASTILMSQRFGAGDIAAARRVVAMSAKVVLAMSLAISMFGVAMSKQMLVLIGTPAESLQMAVAYLKMMLLSLPPAYLFLLTTYMVRAAGASSLATRFLLFSVVLDVILNPVLIFGLGAAPRLGVVGAALATLISQSAGLIVFVSYLYGSKHLLCPRKDELLAPHMDTTVISSLVVKGAPVCLQVLVITLGGSLMVALVNRVGVETAASFAAVNTMWVYIQMPALAVGMAVTLMAAQNVGAQNWDRVQKITQAGLAYTILMTGTGALLIALFARSAYTLLLPAGSSAIDVATHISRIASWSFVFSGMAMVFYGVMRAGGSTIPPLVIEIAHLLGVRVPFAVLLFPRTGPDAIWWSFPFSALLATSVAAYYYRRGQWGATAKASPSLSVGIR